MKKHYLLKLILIGLLMTSCFPDGDEEPSGEPSGKPTSSCKHPDKMHQAVCDNKHDWVGNAWYGTAYCSDNKQENQRKAKEEADNHRNNNPGHDVSVR